MLSCLRRLELSFPKQYTVTSRKKESVREGVVLVLEEKEGKEEETVKEEINYISGEK